MSLPEPPMRALDASVAINLLATGRLEALVRAVGGRVVMVSQAAGEVRRDPRTRTRQEGLLGPYLHPVGPLEAVNLDDRGQALFLELTGADPPDDLGDGEAATIAYAVTTGCCAVIDERKAFRIVRARFGALQLEATTDLLAHPRVLEALGRDHLRTAVHDALRFAHMRVPFGAEVWVRELLGEELARTCPSLRQRP